MENKTAVEWLSQQTLDNWNDIESGARNITEFIEQAKEMEKQQIMEVWNKAGEYLRK